MTVPQACILDLDGTLVDTLGDFVATLERVCADLGLPGVDRAFVARTIGRGSEHLLQQVLAVAGAPPAALPEAWARYQHHYAAVNGQHARVYPGVREGLTAMQHLGVPLACLTNKPAAPARDLLERLELVHHFAWVFGGDTFARRKPDPLPVRSTCDALGTAPHATWVVGDSRNDAQAADAAGCPLVLVTYGYNHGEDITAVPAREHVARLDAISWIAGRSA